MSIDIASVSIPASLELGTFNADLRTLERTKVKPICIDVELDTSSLDKQRKELERTFSKGLDLTIRVDDSALSDLNKHLDLKDRHVTTLQRKWDRSPLTVRVDTSEIDEALDKAERLKKSNSSVSKQSSSKQSSSSQQSSQPDVAQKIEGMIEEGLDNAAKSINSALKVAGKPFGDVFTGLFEGIGMAVSEKLTQGVMGALDKKGVIKLDAITDGITNFLVDTTEKLTSQVKKETKTTSKPSQQADLSNLASLKREAEKLVVAIPTSTKAQVAKQVQVTSREFGKILGNKLLDSLDEEFDILADALSRVQPDIGKAEAQFAKIRQGFKNAYASLNKALVDGNADTAEAYIKTIQDMAKMARKEIDQIQTELKAAGAEGRFGARLPTAAGSTKGHITQYENKATRKTLEVERLRSSQAEATSIGKDFNKGVAKGLDDPKNVIKESSQVAQSIIETVKDDLEIRSPSKKGIEIGKDFVRGIGIGIANTGKQAIAAGKKLSQNLQGSMKSSKTPAPKSATAVAQESGAAAMDNFYDAFGKQFKKVAFKGMPPDMADEMAGEVAGMIFSGLSMAMPSALGAVALGPLLIAALPTVIAGLGVTKLVSPLVSRAVQGIQQVEPIRQRFNIIGGTEEAGKEEFDYANQVAEKYNISKEASLTQYSQLAVAARDTKLEGEGVKELFEGISASTRAMRLSTADSNLVFMAYTQILAKGKISMEELRQQLGEKFPPAMGVFAKAMGVSVAEMNQIIESGNALSEDILPRVAEVLKQDFGKAASGAGGGLTTAITNLENAGFDLSVKLTEVFSNTFGAVTNMASGIFDVFNANFDNILKLGSAFLIGITAQVAVGLQQIVAMPAIAGAMGKVQGAFLSTFAKSFSLLSPFFFGMLIDVADDFFGAQNSIFDNMSKGVTNMVLSIVTLVDDASRNILGTAIFKPDHDNVFGSLLGSAKDFVMGLVQILPPGVVEMGALMIMFEQVSVLGKMYLVPALGNVWTATKGMASGIKAAVTSGQNLRSMFRIMIADSAMAKGAMVALGVAMKGALAFAVMAFAQGDFADELAQSFSKAETSVVNSIKSIGTELEKLKPIGEQVADGLTKLDLKSKGLELNPLKIIGMSEDSFKSDDLLKTFNKVPEALGIKGLNKDWKNRADKLGVGDVFSTQEIYITKAQQQVLNKADDLQRMNKELETRLAKLNLTPSTVQNFVSGDISRAVTEVQAIDQQLKTLRGKRSDLALIDDTASKAAIKGIDKEIDALMKKRKDTASPLTSALGNVDEIKKQLDDVGKAIDADETLPLSVKKAYHKLLEPQKQMVEETTKYLKDQGLYDAVKPLENVWQRITETLHDAELQFDKTKAASESSFKETQTKLYNQYTDKGQLDTALEGAESKFMEETRTRVSGILAQRETALKEMLSISGVETNQQRKEEVDRLKEEIAKGKDEVTGLNLEIAKQNNERQLKFRELSGKIDQYYQSVSDQAAEASRQLSKQMSEIQGQQFANQVNRAMLGVGDSIISQFVGSLLDAIQQISQAADTDLDAQSQIAQAAKAFEDIQKGGEELRSQLPEILPVEVAIDIDSVAANDDIAALGDMIGGAVDETDDLAAATAGVNSMFAESSDLISQSTDDVSYLQSGLEGVAGAVDMGTAASESLNDSVNSTTDSASYLQSQIDANTASVDGTNASMQGVGISIDANTQKTGLTAEQSAKWWAELGTVEKITISVQAVFTAIGVGIMDAISKTVDWFKTFANNVPILNTIGQTISGWGQSIANSGIGQAVGNAAQSVGDWAGQQVDRFTNWVGGGGKVTERYRTGTLAAQEYGAPRPGRKHAGQDLDVSGNQEAQSFIGGKITKVGYDQGGYGHYVDIYNPALKVVERIAEVAQVLVKVGQEIKPGQAIGKGETNTGVFHYEIRTDANAQGQGGSGHTGTVDPIKFYEKLGIVQRQGQNIVIKKGLNAGQTVNQAEHHVGDGHNHYGEEDAKKANQQAARATSDQLAQAGRNATARRGGSNGNAVQANAGDYTKRSKEENIQTIVNEAIRLGVTDKAQISYIVATALHESGNFRYFEEQGPDSRFAHYGGGARYKGRGMVQLTHKSNYAKQGERLGLDLVNNPELIRDANVAANILVHGMITGGFTGRRLDQYVGNGKNDVNNARRTVNGYVQAQVNQVNAKYNEIAPQIDQYIARAGQGGSVPSAPQSAAPAFQPTATPTVWAPESLSQSGNARITQAQTSAAQQRDAQQAAAAQQALVQAESGTIQGLQKGYQSLWQVEKQLRQSGYETRDLFEDIGKMNLEALGPLTIDQQRQQAAAELERQYRDTGEKLDEKIRDVQNRQTAAQAILDQPGGVLTPAVRAKFDKLLSMPISEDLKARLQEAMTTGVFGDQLKSVLERSVTQGNQEIATLTQARAELTKGEGQALKAIQERFAFEEKARANAAKFEQESLDIAVLQANLDQLKGQADREGVGSKALEQIPAVEALIALSQKQLDYDKQIQDLEEKKRNKTLTEDEANKQIEAIKKEKDITEQTVRQNQAYQELVNTRALDARNREASIEQARQELAVSKQQIEALKALPESDIRRNEIPLLEYQVELQELQLKLQEDIASVNDAVFKGDRTKEQGEARINELKKEYELNQANLGVRLKQQTVEQKLAQQRAVLGIREQELGFAEQLLEAQTRSIELGRTTGDKLGDRYALQTEQQKLAFEQQILDIKEMGLQSGKSAEEVAAIEAQLRQVNDIKLDNITAEMEKAFSDRAFAVQQRVGESSNSVLSAEQSLMNTYGFTQEANRIGKKLAINQQTMDFASQQRELDEFIKTNAVAADKAALLRDNLKSVNDIKFREIEAQFNPLKGVIDSSVGALKGAFKSLIKDGKVDFDSFFDGILDSIADFLSNMLVEELMGFLSPDKDKKKGGEIFPNATADPNSTDPFAGVADPLGLIGGKSTSIFENPAASLLGTSPVQPMFVSVTNTSQFGFAQGANNIVPFNSNSTVGGLSSFGNSIFGGKTNLISPLTSSFGDLDSFLKPGFSGITAQNPLAVNVTQAKPDLFSSILGGVGGGGSLGGIVQSVMGGLGGGGFGGIIGSILPIFGSIFGGLFAKGGVIGSGRGEKDDQLILAQRGEGILTHEGMKAIGGAAALNAINRSKGYRVPKFAMGGMVGGEYGGRGSADKVSEAQEERRKVSNEPIKLETTVINGIEYATVEQVRIAASQARSEGARDGATAISNKLMNSTKFRNQHGIR